MGHRSIWPRRIPSRYAIAFNRDIKFSEDYRPFAPGSYERPPYLDSAAGRSALWRATCGRVSGGPEWRPHLA